MKLHNASADIFIPDGTNLPDALARTTHLGIGAHQDDLEFMAYHGIAECYRKPGRAFTGVVVTDGAGSSRIGRYANYTDDDMITTRRGEQHQAASIGEYAAMFQLGYPSSAVKDPTNRHITEDIFAILESAKPRFVYLHNLADKHDSHVAVAGHAIKALRQLPVLLRPEKVYGCEVWRNLDWLVDADKIVQNVSAHPDLAARLTSVFDSQIAGGKRYDLAVMGRRLSNATFFDSHSSDATPALQWAMDLTPLIADEASDILEYTMEFVTRFQNDIRARIEKYT